MQAGSFDLDGGRGVARWIFTDRLGGVSASPFGSLNLGGHVGDDSAAVEANRRALARVVGLPRERLMFMDQVHGDSVATVDDSQTIPDATDAIVTATRGLGLVVLVADCVPVLMADPQSGVLAAIHSGRKGVRAHVAVKALQRMVNLGAEATAVHAVIGPAICGSCYEVPAAMRDDVAEHVPAARAFTRVGAPALDLRAAVADELTRRAVTVTTVGPCTAESARPLLVSARRYDRPVRRRRVDRGPVIDSNRQAELTTRLAEVRARIARACEASGRAPTSVTLIIVTKTWPASDIRLLAGLGVRDVGENRDQEAAPKAAECAGFDLRWHFVGQLQTNKARSVARYAHAVHSVDRLGLVSALNNAAAAADRRVGALIQVSLDLAAGRSGAAGNQPERPRGGVAAAEVPDLADAVAASQHLDLRGLMAVAPLGEDPSQAFERLGVVAARLRSAHPSATWLSAGMSGDLEAAIAMGATHVRVGSAVLGSRPPLG